jgi:hypothetical protein
MDHRWKNNETSIFAYLCQGAGKTLKVVEGISAGSAGNI